ncbi:hypothetical protein C0995_004482 [Termitomyces sp. Mi166|nr:hypothetical protein C0995_004482 [Termitomyces sp. Mi166\
MLYNNYTQALRIINVDGPKLEHMKEQLNINEGDLEKWRLEQKEYFSSLTNNQFLILTPDDALTQTYASALSATWKWEMERCYMDEHQDHLTCDVILLEERLGIPSGQRWTFLSPEFLEVSRYIARRRYEKALDKLQKLVIQWLFELQKLNLSSTGYKMCSHIAKSLQMWCNAIQTADTSHDVWEKHWAQPIICKMIQMEQRIKHAHEETICCNVKVHCLHTSIVNENTHFAACLKVLKETNSPIYSAVEEFVERRCHVNAQLLVRISQIYSLPGFTGVHGPGVKQGSMSMNTVADEIRVAEEAGNTNEQIGIDDYLLDGEDEDDEEVEALDSLVNFIGGLSLNV